VRFCTGLGGVTAVASRQEAIAEALVEVL